MKKLPVLFLLLLLLCPVCYAQMEKIKEIQKQLPFIHDSLRYVDALNRLGMLSYENNVDTSFYYTIHARDMADRLQYNHGKADAANNMGVVYDMTGNLQLALRYYNDAYNKYKKLNDSVNMVQTMMNIALVYQEIGKDEKAIKTFKSTIAFGDKLSRDSMMALVLYNYTLVYPDAIRKDSILIYINRATKIAKKYNDVRLILAIEQLTADYYINNNQRDRGLALLQQDAASTVQHKLYYLCLDMLIDLGNQFAETDSAKAIGFYKQGLDICGQKGYKIYTGRITRILYDFYVARKDNVKAFYYSRQLLQLHDEQAKTDVSSGIDYIEYAIKDQQLESAQVQSKYQQLFLLLAILVAVMAMCTLFILWRNWKRLRRTTEALSVQFHRSETAMEALDAMNKDYARLIKIVAHDLRNPIGGISAIAGIMQLSADALPADTVEMVDLIQVSSKNCLELINELLKTDFDQHQNFNAEPVDIDELLLQCVRLLSFRATDKKQQLLLNTNLRLKIPGDREKLWRVMNNLIVNAIKFSPNGSKIDIDTRQLQHGIMITVRDRGVGIPVAMQNKIFDPFTSAKRRGTQGEQPFGLGLYISKQIIESHNGKIWFESEDGKGTVFYIVLPTGTGTDLSV